MEIPMYFPSAVSSIVNGKTYVKSFPVESSAFPISHRQYGGCLWPDDPRNEGFSDHDIELDGPD